MGYIVVGMFVVAVLLIAISENDHVHEWILDQAKKLWSWPKRLRKVRAYQPRHSSIILIPTWPTEGES